MLQESDLLKQELMDVLDEECRWYEKILGLMKEKTDILVNNDVEALKKNTVTMNEYLTALDGLEARRRETVEKICARENIPRTEASLGKIAHVWQEPSLRDRQKKLQALMGDLKKINERNQRLLAQAEGVFSFLRNLLYSAFADGPVTSYTNEGKIDQRKGGYFEKEI